MKVIGSRNRKCIKETGEWISLNIRRLKCSQCPRVHHELPDILIPYKRYDRNSIEAAIAGDSRVAVAADQSTLYRWRTWLYELLTYLLGCLEAISIRIGKLAVEEAILPKSALQKLWHYVGNADGWLARIVQTVANQNLWVQTRSAFLSKQ